MTIKRKASLYTCLFFSVLFGMVCIVVIQSFANFRQEEFQARLSEKARTTVKLLVEVKEVDNALLKIIDRNTINQLYNEKTLVFDGNYQLIYSSLDDTRLNWTKEDLIKLKKEGTSFRKDGDNEVYGVYYDGKNRDFFALISANDNYGKRKLSYLVSLMLFSYLIFTAATFGFTFYLIKQQLEPLDTLVDEMRLVNDLSVPKQIPLAGGQKNEINLIRQEFNHMMRRIVEVFNQQKDFTAHASHELRTPLLRLSTQVENMIVQSTEPQRPVLRNLLKDINHLSGLINSLLLLTRNQQANRGEQSPVRLDEALFNAIEKATADYDLLQVDLTIDDSEEMAGYLELNANQPLMEIAFYNLLANAYLYSESKKVQAIFSVEDHRLVLAFRNDGPVLSGAEANDIFFPFVRAGNAVSKSGLGIGLTIVRRILNSFHLHITYVVHDGWNEFRITSGPQLS